MVKSCKTCLVFTYPNDILKIFVRLTRMAKLKDFDGTLKSYQKVLPWLPNERVSFCVTLYEPKQVVAIFVSQLNNFILRINFFASIFQESLFLQLDSFGFMF